MKIDENTRLGEDLRHVAEQEALLQFAAFNESSAWALGRCLYELASSRDHAVLIDIRRFNQTLFHAALPGTTPDNAEWVRRKSNVVARFFRSSYGVGLYLQQQKATLQEKQGLPLSDFSPHGGSFPLSVHGTGVIGSVTVSGLPQRLDHELVVEALCQQLGMDYAAVRLPPE